MLYAILNVNLKSMRQKDAIGHDKLCSCLIDEVNRVKKMIELLEKETGISADTIPYYDREIYFSFYDEQDYNSENIREYLPTYFYCVYDAENGFYGLCRSIGISKYFPYLHLYSKDIICAHSISLSEIPYCKEEFDELNELYLNKYSFSCDAMEIGWRTMGTKEPLRTFGEIIRQQKHILSRSEIHEEAKSLFALQWYNHYYPDEYIKCRLKMYEINNKSNCK